MRGWNKKGSFIEPTKIFYYIGVLFSVLLFMFFFTSLITTFALNQNPIPTYLGVDIAASRITNVCFAYKNPKTNELIPGVLDITKITQENLDNCFREGDSYEKVSFTLQSNPPIKLATIGTTTTSRTSRFVLIINQNGELSPNKIIVEK